MTTQENRRIPADVADAVTALYRAAYRDVLRSTTVLAGAADAPDLVQYAFQQAALKWDEVGSRSPDGQKAWLRTVSRNRFIDDLRRDVRFDDLHFKVCEHYTAAPHDPADVTVARDALERCWAVISAMPEAQRAVAVLAWREGLDPAEIARSLGISPATVRVQLHKARRRLTSEIGNHLPFARPDAAKGTAQKRRAS
ncbi:sigma-70 family RNA polymerase sigma factor [Kitasatospora sp. NPDC036755]|uniref:RNA polymerase sigma factor n=1 Tax=Kitasatospora sp. NPDC036755 TaxID=3154600 RepID=UPI003408A027